MRIQARRRRRRIALIGTAVIGAVGVVALACKSQDDSWWKIERCEPACSNGQVCCYLFVYYGDADVDADATATKLFSPDGRLEIEVHPKCGTLVVDSDIVDINGDLDGAPGHCELYPPL